MAIRLKKIPPKFDRRARMKIAALAECDERTVYRYLRGECKTLRLLATSIEDAIAHLKKVEQEKATCDL